MKTKKLSIILGMVASCYASNLFAQTTLTGDHVITGNLNVGASGANGGLVVAGQTGNSATPGILVTGDGGVLWQGTFGTGLIPATGAGTRFMWYPKKAALRAGRVASTNWDDANVGDYSVAFGAGSKASGVSSVAFGVSTSTASGQASLASGNQVNASGNYSTALGNGVSATGYAGVAINSWGSASGESSFSAGTSSSASGSASFAQGTGVVASGSNSVAHGDFSISSGRDSFSSGYRVTAASFASAVFGMYNVVEGSAITWEPLDPLFVVGNGTGVVTDPPEVRNRNAFTIYKNGNIKITKRQGDILMGEFGNPE